MLAFLYFNEEPRLKLLRDHDRSNTDRWRAHLQSQAAETVSFWATVCKTVRPTLSHCCLSCPVCPVLSCLWRWCIVAKRLDGPRWNLACR